LAYLLSALAGRRNRAVPAAASAFQYQQSWKLWERALGGIVISWERRRRWQRRKEEAGKRPNRELSVTVPGREAV